VKTVSYKDATAFLANPAASEVVLLLSDAATPKWFSTVVEAVHTLRANATVGIASPTDALKISARLGNTIPLPVFIATLPRDDVSESQVRPLTPLLLRVCRPAVACSFQSRATAAVPCRGGLIRHRCHGFPPPDADAPGRGREAVRGRAPYTALRRPAARRVSEAAAAAAHAGLQHESAHGVTAHATPARAQQAAQQAEEGARPDGGGEEH
jgi:hypothetical protein